ncbi:MULTISPECIES: polysaccharide biosynthesis/export family protein [Prochlorococcus]|uniref:Putative polysaccharide export or synthesis protein n=1 Tax=Prochlorococcus marinus str. MIT 9116 TaxID=167544 RepID=A0A0A1ZXU1_PROMR|nr:polysaccharide biosynthesis/export family protein [Prochlorococcus marinus]KGF91972.1 putative polysaccharide export or synthesis protein [Prochlorococcus marinus str. MIT 9107]KGF93059.1 putative polysaccharide export or synthesis protein [Prochlorococcus marinus str. MIT 9116]KGF93983.1 putative polysaccharide export or synthesis protein [Prochlorococcus marinus str. MIT 9123]
MLKILNFNKKNFLFFLITTLLFSQSEINKVYSDVKNDQNSIDVEYLEKINDDFYILDEGDLLGIQIIDLIEELEKIQVVIDSQGNIVVPEIGRVFVSGLTINELENLLNKKLLKIIREPDVKISVIAPKPLKVSIRGEVKNPGMYTFFYGDPQVDNDKANYSKIGFTPTVFNAIQKAGGISPFSDLTNIEVIRQNPISNGGGQIKTKLNLLKVLTTGDKSQNIKLKNNDNIYVAKGDEKITFKIKEALKSNINSPFINVYISGDVRNAGPLNLKRDTDLNTAIIISGGQGFFKGNVTLSRFTSDGGYSNKTFRFNRNNKRGSKKNPYLKEGDIIFVGKHSLKVVNEIVTDLTRPFVGIYSTYKIFDF